MREERFSKTAKGRAAAAGLILLSIAVTVWLGIRSASDAPPTASESAVLVVLAGLLQVAAGANIFRAGRADPAHARSSVRRLIQVASRSEEARRAAEAAYEEFSATRGKSVLGQLSVHLSYIEEGATLAVEDWMEFHGDALKEVVTSKDGQTRQRKAQ